MPASDTPSSHNCLQSPAVRGQIHKKTVLQRLFPFQITTYTKKIASHVTDTLVTDPQSLTEICTFLSSAFLTKTLTSSQLNKSKPLPPGLAYHKAVYTLNTPTIYNRFSPFDMPERSMLPTSTQLRGGKKTRLSTPLVFHYELNTNCNSCSSLPIDVLLVINTIQIFYLDQTTTDCQ